MTATTASSHESQHPCEGLEPLSLRDAKYVQRRTESPGFSKLTGLSTRMQQHTYVSPSDYIMSPATQKLAAFKTKHLGKG